MDHSKLEGEKNQSEMHMRSCIVTRSENKGMGNQNGRFSAQLTIGGA